jgi:hypothetical protein
MNILIVMMMPIHSKCSRIEWIMENTNVSYFWMQEDNIIPRKIL